MWNGGFQSGILMATIPISDTRNYCRENERINSLEKTLSSTEGNVGAWQSTQKKVTARECCKV